MHSITWRRQWVDNSACPLRRLSQTFSTCGVYRLPTFHQSTTPCTLFRSPIHACWAFQASTLILRHGVTKARKRLLELGSSNNTQVETLDRFVLDGFLRYGIRSLCGLGSVSLVGIPIEDELLYQCSLYCCESIRSIDAATCVDRCMAVDALSVLSPRFVDGWQEMCVGSFTFSPRLVDRSRISRVAYSTCACLKLLMWTCLLWFPLIHDAGWNSCEERIFSTLLGWILPRSGFGNCVGQ